MVKVVLVEVELVKNWTPTRSPIYVKLTSGLYGTLGYTELKRPGERSQFQIGVPIDNFTVFAIPRRAITNLRRSTTLMIVKSGASKTIGRLLYAITIRIK